MRQYVANRTYGRDKACPRKHMRADNGQYEAAMLVCGCEFTAINLLCRFLYGFILTQHCS
jgi:hypothetical protein